MVVNRGHIICIEGVDGSGKSTQAKLLKEWFGPLAILEPEPTRTPLGQWIRRELKEKKRSNRDLQNLFIANRVEHFGNLEPKLASGINVIMDRGETSTAAYGKSSNDFTAEEVLEIHRRAMIPKPDILLFMKLPPNTAKARRTARNDGKERFDDDEFQEKLAKTYEELRDAKEYNWVDIDASGSVDEVHKRILSELREHGMITDAKKPQHSLRFNLAETVLSLSASCDVPLYGQVIDRYMSCDRVLWLRLKNPPEALIEAAEKLSKFMETLSKAVQERWYANHLEERDIFGLLHGEAGELAEYIAKEKRDRREYADEIAAESVDLIFYLGKVITDSKTDVKKLWESLAFNPTKQHELQILGEQSIETMAQTLSFMCVSIGSLVNSRSKVTININTDPEPEPEKDPIWLLHYRHICGLDDDCQNDIKPEKPFETKPLTFDFETGCGIALYLALKLVEKLNIDFDSAWEKKMSFNAERFEGMKREEAPPRASQKLKSNG